MNKQHTIQLAAIAHEVNRAYCAALGDTSQPAWEEAPEWQRASAQAGVEMHLANPDATPEQSHAAWLAQKLAEGWAYGEDKDAEQKLHPCCLPYDELPAEQKAKDHIFAAVVRNVAPLLRQQAQVLSAVSAPAQVTVAVRYIGPRETWTDHRYRTRLQFSKGQVRRLPSALAERFLRHSDLFEPAAVAEAGADGAIDADTADALEQTEAEASQAQEQQRELADVMMSVQQMTKKELGEFAEYHFKAELNTRKTVGELREDVISMIDRFGLV